MYAKIPVTSVEESMLIMRGLKMPAVRAMVKVMASLDGLDSDKDRHKAILDIAAMMTKEGIISPNQARSMMGKKKVK